MNDPTKDDDLAWMRALPDAPAGSTIFGHTVLDRGGPMHGALLDIRGAIDHVVTPDKKGNYRVTGLPAGEYRIAQTLPTGFVGSPERTVTVVDKGCAEVDWYAYYDGHVRGHVADVDGKPLGKLSMVLGTRDPDSYDGVATRRYAQTSEDGSFDFSTVGPGDYVVVANNIGATATGLIPRCSIRPRKTSTRRKSSRSAPRSASTPSTW